MSATVSALNERRRLGGRLALLRAAELADDAAVAIRALVTRVDNARFNETYHASAVAQLERAVVELRNAERACAGLPTEDGAA